MLNTLVIPDTKERIQKLQERIVRESLDALLIISRANQRYLANFSGSAAWVVVAPENCSILVDGRYVEQAEQECPSHMEKVRISEYVEGFPKELAPVLHQGKIKRLGIEASQLTLFSARQIEENCGVTLVSTLGWVEALRIQKTKEEIGLIQEAIAAAEKALRKAVDFLEAGVKEEEAAWKIEESLHQQGHAVSFESIVASGPRSAMPHGKPTYRKIQKGEPVVIDMGACVQGYHSDITRTVLMGEPPEEARKIFDLLCKAQECAVKAIRPGITAKEADSAARKVIQDAGYGDAFCHGLGHGIGLEVHEAPSLRKTSEQVLTEGMVITVEPGVYLPGKFGLRLEDDVLITENGCQVLTSFPKDLRISA